MRNNKLQDFKPKVFTGLGQTLANVSLFIFPILLLEQQVNYPHGFLLFFLGAVCSIVSVWWSSHTTKEIPPTPEELLQMQAEKQVFFTPFIDIMKAIVDMPKSCGNSH